VSDRKTVLITGASSGIGAAVAKSLADEGCKIILLARRLDKLEALRSELNTEVYIAQVDILDKRQVVGFFDNLPEDFRDIDVLINNAGVEIGLESFQDRVPEDWEIMVSTNVVGLLQVTHTVIKSMLARNIGQIINISSVAAYVPYEGGSIYGGTKAFVSHFSRNPRVDLHGTNIRVTNIEPGSVETELAEGINRYDHQKAANHYNGFKPLSSEDIARTVSWTLQQPEHVNIDEIKIMPTVQTYAGIATKKQT
jgi:3-hydroxy acid dehydrogenase / malonic semialdehyde reductase